MIPLEGELRTALWRLWEQNQERSPRVVLSSRGRTPLAPGEHLPDRPAGPGPGGADRRAADGSAA